MIAAKPTNLSQYIRLSAITHKPQCAIIIFIIIINTTSIRELGIVWTFSCIFIVRHLAFTGQILITKLEMAYVTYVIDTPKWIQCKILD